MIRKALHQHSMKQKHTKSFFDKTKQSVDYANLSKREADFSAYMNNGESVRSCTVTKSVKINSSSHLLKIHKERK